MLEKYQKFKQKLDELFNKYRIYIGVFLTLFIILGGTVLMVQGANAQKNSNVIKSTDIIQLSQTNTDPAQTDKKPEEIIFDIEGAINTPGVYKIPIGSVLIDAINKAGGLSVEADNERIARELNQASVIGNNAKLYIFKNSDKDIQVVNNTNNLVSNSSASLAANNNLNSQASTTKINLNKATLQELDTLPKIGPVLAQRIIDWRDANGGFEVIEDLKKVKGIGDSTFEGLKDLIIIE